MNHSESYRRILTKMRYYDYQHGFIHRHVNQEGGWEPHQQKCRELIMEAIEIYRPRKITALGTGWLLEMPLAEMLENTEEIVLVDIIHPPDVHRQTEGMKKIRLVEADATGGLIEEVWNKAGRRSLLNRIDSLESIVIPEYNPGEDPGLVLSINLLTQLEYLPLKLLRAKSKAAEPDLDHFREEVQKSHLRFLMKHPSLLITDVAEIYTDDRGNRSEVKTAFVPMPEGKINREWIWDFDLKYSDYKRKRSLLRVCAALI